MWVFFLDVYRAPCTCLLPAEARRRQLHPLALELEMTGCPPGLGKLNLGAGEEQTVLLTAELPRKQTDRYSYLFTSCGGQGTRL